MTGSCLLTSVASTMEPRKVRKLKILTGFRPVSDQFQTLCPERTKKKKQKNRLSSMSEVNGYRKSKGTKDLRKITQLNLLKMYVLVLVVIVIIKIKYSSMSLSSSSSSSSSSGSSSSSSSY